MFGRSPKKVPAAAADPTPPADPAEPDGPPPAPAKHYADPRVLSYSGVALIALGIVLSIAGATGGDEVCSTKTETTTKADRPVEEVKVVDCRDRRPYEGPVVLTMTAGAFLLLPQVFNSLPGGSKVKANATGVELEVGADEAAGALAGQAPQDRQAYERRRAAITPPA